MAQTTNLADSSPRYTLLIGFSTLILLLAGIAGNALYQQHLVERFETIKAKQLSKLYNATIMNNAWRDRALLMFDMLYDDDPFSRDATEQRHRVKATEFQLAHQAFAASTLDDTEQRLLRELDRTTRYRYKAQLDAIAALQDDDFARAERILRRDILPGHIARSEVLLQLNDYQRDQIQAASAQTEERLNSAKKNTFGLSLSALWVALIIAVYVYKQAMHKHRVSEQARQRAAHADEAKSAFLANMSHEIRTPLNAINGMTKLLEHSPLDDTQREYVEVLDTSSESLLGVINDILDFSKIEAGKLEMESRPFDLRDSLYDAMEIRASAAYAKGLEFGYHIARDIPEVLIGDSTRLRQIVVNLIGNAVKFTEYGEVSLHATRIDQQIRIEIRDTGIGLNEQTKANLFQRFTQAESSTTRRYGGTGLGLAISKYLVEAMGGDIGVSDNPNADHGCCFYFHLPLPEKDIALETLGRHANPDLSGQHIMVVEPSPASRVSLSEWLTDWGAKVTSYSGPDELQQASLKADIALIDARWLLGRIHPQSLGQPKTLAMVPIGQELDLSNIALSGQLAKPIRPQRLVTALLRLLGKEGASDEPSSGNPIDKKLAQRHPLRILLAEDSEMNRLVARSMLGKLGYSIDSVDNGQQAVTACQNKDYDLVLMDVQMPVMDGIQATEEIKRSLAPSRCPWIVAMTANAMSGDRERFLKAGMDDYIAKPVDFDDISRILSTTPSQRRNPSNGPQNSRSENASPAQPASPPIRNAAPPAQHPEPDPSIIDPQQLEQLRSLTHDGDIQAFIDIYLRDSGQWLSQIRQQFTPDTKPDNERVKTAAHPLKSNSRQVGALKVAELAEQLELAAAGGQLDSKEATVLALQQAHEQARAELSKCRKQDL